MIYSRINFVCFLFLISTFTVYGQSANLPDHFIATTSGDTIVAPKRILSAKKWTNEDQVSFKFNYKTKTLSAAQVVSYFDDQLYKKIHLKSKKKHKLAQIIVHGEVKLAQSRSKKGKTKFYIYHNEDWRSLEGQEWTLNKYLSKHLQDFDNSGAGDTRIYYTIESLANAISAYNHFMNPEHSRLVDFKYKPEVSAGIYAAGLFQQIAYEGLTEKFDPGFGTAFGFQVKFNYSRKFAMVNQLEYASSNFVSDFSEVKLKSINGNFIFTYNIYAKEDRLKLDLGVGYNANFNIDSEIFRFTGILGERRTVDIQNIDSGFGLYSFLHFKSPLTLSLSYNYFNRIKTESFKPQSTNFGEILTNNSLRLALHFDF